ncbi:hypothetical protein B0T12DRAFT_343626 [Alternaria alternata]|nr:hypothetical protein B0T12DRAFT_343626 [Alternaria alternata]
MDFSHMQTPPPTRDASSRRSVQQSGGTEVATPATVVHRTPSQLPESSGGLFNQTPYGFADLQYTPHMMQFPSHGPMSAPPMPQSKLFWDPANDGMQMDLDVPLGVDPFGPTPHRPQHDMNWQAMNQANMMQTPAFQSFQASPMPASFANTPSQRQGSRPGSFVYTSAGVDPNMLLSFSNPDMTSSFGNMPDHPFLDMSRQPYETQLRDAQNEREMAKKSRSQHSRSNTASSTGSAENAKPVLQRSNTDGGIMAAKSLAMDPRTSIPANASTIPRRSSPLKRQGGGALKSIPELRRPRTRLIIDETGRARTETVHAGDDEETPKNKRQTSQQDLRRQYPGLYEDDESESEDDEPAPVISRNSSFAIPQPERRAAKHARADSGGLERPASFKMARSVSASRVAPDALSKASFELLRSTRRSATDNNTTRRFSAMERPMSSAHPEDHHMPDSPGDALGALKKVVGARQQRIERASQNTLLAHNQRWAQASADISNLSTTNLPHNHNYDPYSNSFNHSPSTTTTPSTECSARSNDSTRCVCEGMVEDEGMPMVQCEACNKWLHLGCVGMREEWLPKVFVCVFCTGTDGLGRVMRRGGAGDSPLKNKRGFR